MALVAALGAAAPAPAAAQFFPFGANKVHYRHLDWRVLAGAHVDLYFYPEEASLAPMALAAAEAGYDTLAVQFGHEVATRIPLVLYASPRDFEQTNVLPFRPPESILGATDFLKRRVILPYRGNLTEFLHTLRHELVHVFQIDIASQSYHKGARSVAARLPLWWTEGLAEYWSAGEDARDEMLLRDLVLGGTLPDLQALSPYGSGLEYSLGGRVMRWIGQTYGDWRLARMQHDLWTYDSFEGALRGIYGKSLAELNREFQLVLRREYYPVAQDRAPLGVLGERIADRAIEPAYFPDDDGGGRLFFISPARGYVSILQRDLSTGRTRTVAESGRSPELESLHPFQSRFDAGREGLLLYAGRRDDRDALFIRDLSRRRTIGRYQFTEVAGIHSPAWAPDGRSAFFSGMGDDGLSDLYRVHFPDGTLERLTDDFYQDLDPSPSPDGTRLVFASDRAAGGREGALNLFVMDLGSRNIRQLTAGTWQDDSPTWDREGRIWFTSDRDGVLNVFSVDSVGDGRRETSVWTGVLDARPVPGREAVVASGFDELQVNAFLLPLDTLARADTFALAPAAAHSRWQPPGAGPAPVDTGAAEPYRRRMTLDFLTGEGAVVAGYGGGVAATALLSDLLGDHLAAVSAYSYQGEALGSFVDNLSVSAVYLNQARRVNWAAGAFRLSTRNFEGERVVAFVEKTTGALGQVRYPLNRFERVEGTMVVEYSDRTDFTLPVDEPRRQGWIVSQYASYVRDNSVWLSSGPIEGTRLALTAGVGNDFSNARFDAFLLRADVRKYLRLGLRSAYALRLFGHYSGGDRPRRTNIGGTLALRGYPLFGYIVGTKAWMANQEVRFPLLRHLTLGTPAGDVRLPSAQGALFLDVGQATMPDGPARAVLGSAGLGIRWPVLPLSVLRLDLGWRFASRDFQGYALDPDRRDAFFVSFFFGYNY